MKTKNSSAVMSDLLFSAGSYHEFLKLYFRYRKKEDPHFSYAVFSNKGGFSSRSLPRDIMLGKKHLTPHSLPKLLKALSLKGPLRTYFKLLVLLDEPKLNSGSMDETRIRSLLKRAKARYEVSEEGVSELPSGKTSVLTKLHWPLLYAALGTEAGAALTEIASRSAIPKDQCQSALSEMLKASVIQYDADTERYQALNPHLIYQGIGEKIYFETFFQGVLKDLITRMEEKRISNASDLLFASMVSVQSAKMPLFKEKLRELILNFVDETEDPLGDSVAKIAVSLFV